MTETIRTAFDARQRALGGDLVEWEGWYWPNHFGDPVAEHHAVRTAVGVWDASPLRKWLFRGADALGAADYAFTNDMAGLEVGQVRYAPFCDENGKMVGDGTVFKLADDHCWAVTALDSDLDHMRAVRGGPFGDDRGEDGRAAPARPERPALARGARLHACDAEVESLGYFRFWPETVTVGGVPCRVSRTGLLRGARLRALLRPGGRPAVGRRRRHRCASVRSGRGRDDPHRVGPRLHRLRLLPTRDEPVRHGARPPRSRLDKDDFHGRAALEAEGDAPANRFVTLVVDGAVPEYGAAVTRVGDPSAR